MVSACRNDDLDLGTQMRLAGLRQENQRAWDTVDQLRTALKDMIERVEASWERRDLAPDSDLEAVEKAKELL